MQHLSSTYDLSTGSALIHYRLSLPEHSWLAHYNIFDRLGLAGGEFIDLALAAGLEVGCARVVELTIATPLMISSKNGLQVQLQVQSPDAQGLRAFCLYSLDEPLNARSGCRILNATGVLAAVDAVGEEAPAAAPLAEWPPNRG